MSRIVRFTAALSQNLTRGELNQLKDVSLRSRPASGKDAVEIRIPLRSLGLELEKQLPRAAAYRDLPRGRKRAGWKKDFLRSLEAAAAEMGDVSGEEILKTVKETREILARRKRPPISALEELKQSSESAPPRRRPSSTRNKLPEITVVARTKTKTA